MDHQHTNQDVTEMMITQLLDAPRLSRYTAEQRATRWLRLQSYGYQELIDEWFAEFPMAASTAKHLRGQAYVPEKLLLLLEAYSS